MTTVAEFATSTYTFPAVDSVSFTMPNGSKALVRVNSGSASGAVAFQAVIGTSRVIGPFQVGDVLNVFAQRGSCDYVVVDQEGGQYPYPSVSLTSAEVARVQAGVIDTTAALLPAAATSNAKNWYRVTDENGGTLYYSTGVSMVKMAPGLTEYDIASCLWADRGTGVVGQVKRITNVGNNTLLEAVWDGTRWGPRGGKQLIYSSRGNLDGSSATTSVVTLPSVTIPGALLGVNFGLEVEIATHTLASAATTANTISYTFGGFELFGTDRTTNRRIWNARRLRNMNATNVQTVMSNASGMGAFEAAANDPKETTKDTTADVAMAGTATAVAASAMVNRCDEFKIWWIGA